MVLIIGSDVEPLDNLSNFGRRLELRWRLVDVRTAQKTLEALEAEWKNQEEQWTEELIEARKGMIDIEARLQFMERKQTAEREKEDAAKLKLE